MWQAFNLLFKSISVEHRDTVTAEVITEWNASLRRLYRLFLCLYHFPDKISDDITWGY